MKGERVETQPGFQPEDRVSIGDSPTFLPGNATVIKVVEVVKQPRTVRERASSLLGHKQMETFVRVQFDDFDAECSVQDVPFQYLTPLTSA